MENGSAVQGRDAHDPLLSVVINVTEGGDAIADLLHALSVQIDAPRMEILIPCDASMTPLHASAQSQPAVHLVPMGAVRTKRPPQSAAGQHELFDLRRAAGLAAATGDIVAMLEDRARPRPGWARHMMRLHEMPHAVIGGAIECGEGRLLGWALYVCDFGRYGLPVRDGPSEWVSDVNLAYKRRAVEMTRTVWRDGYREPLVHGALLEHGEILYLSSDPVVDHRRSELRLRSIVAERFHWGRLYGHIRSSSLSPVRRMLYTAAAPLIPLRLLWRHARMQISRRKTLRFVRAMPLIGLLLTAWSVGEVVGYATNRP